MKNIVFVLVLISSIFNSSFLLSQNVAINATGSAPNTSAMLDVQSNSKGMLIPRMTTAQRKAIASPATGLLVFDNTTGSFWFKSASRWVELVDSSNTIWTKENLNVYLNNGENVGIGTSNPEVRLEVDHGTDVAASGGGFLQLGANSLANLAFDNNEIQARNNATTSTFYLQNSGGELQIGSSSGSAADVYIANGKLIKSGTGNFNMMPLCYGKIAANASIISATPNVSVAKISKGYSITASGINSNTILIATINNGFTHTDIIYAKYTSPGKASIYIYSAEAEDYMADEFSFIFYNP